MATVRYWAGARTAAGTAEQIIEAATLGAVLGEVRKDHGAAMSRLLAVSVVLVDGVQVSDGDIVRTVSADSVIEILPPYAGGAQ